MVRIVWGVLPGLALVLLVGCQDSSTSSCNITKRDQSVIIRVDGDCTDRTFEGQDLSDADLSGVMWGNTICPDGTNSDEHPDKTCRDHRDPAATSPNNQGDVNNIDANNTNPNNTNPNNSEPNNAVEPDCVQDDECMEGFVCVEGVCLYDCAQTTCPALSPYCDGDTIARSAPAGTCDPLSGQCIYEDVTRLDCGEQGLLCVRGVCEDVLGNMVEVPAGPFLYGQDGVLFLDDASPQREVTLSAFYIDKFEVRARDYDVCVDQGGCTPPIRGDDPRYTSQVRPNHPINGVTWEQAQAYCMYQGKRLPTEAQWEKAARGDDGRLYPWGIQDPSCVLANFWVGENDLNTGCEGTYTVPVGSYPNGESPYGAHDMAGNVDEWVADWYSEFYYADAPSSDPPGPVGGDRRVIRGGNWDSADTGLYVPYRNFQRPQVERADIGFRCARDAVAP